MQSAADEPGVAGISITETSALVEGLDRADLGALLASAGERAALQEMLQRILADPQSTAAFVTEFDRWPALLDVLAEHRQLALARDEPTGEIDALIDRVAALIDAHPQRGRLLGELSAHGQPYAVALVLVRVHIDPVQFGLIPAGSPVIDSRRHRVLKAPHPSPLSAHRGFLGCGHFSSTNQYLANTGQSPIGWSLPPASALLAGLPRA